ncbi:MAG: CapA family protein [Blautia sp.]|nr:CapA family protein [Blautia sp.]
MKITRENSRKALPAWVLLTAAICLMWLCPAQVQAAKKTTITISAAGDCTLGRNYAMGDRNSWNYRYDNQGYSYFLKKVSSIFKKDDLTIVNLEGVLSNSAKRLKTFYRQKSGKVSKKSYCHLGKPKYLKALTHGGVDVVSFANNHNIDYGLQGFKDTVNACKNYKLPVAYYDTLVRYHVKGLTVGVISIDSTYCKVSTAEKYLRQGMADLRHDCDLIIACMHWGENYVKQASSEEKKLGHLCVDLGADMVLGCHAHILQGVERYKGRYIFYSLGNFTYGGRAVPADVETMIAQQTFTFVDGKLQIDDNVKIIPCWMSTSKKINNFQPVVKTGSAGRSVIDKINSRSKKFSLKFKYDGTPNVKKEKNTKLPAFTDPYRKLHPSMVPSIIKTLLRM